MLSKWIVYILWRRIRVLWNRQQKHTAGGRQTWQRSFFCLEALIQISPLPTPALFRDEQTLIPFENIPSRLQSSERRREGSSPLTALLQMYFHDDPVDTCLISQHCQCKAFHELVVHGTTHFSISSNPVLHFSDSKNEKTFK